MNTPNRFGSRWKNRLKSWFGLPWQRRLARAALRLDSIRCWERELQALSDGELRQYGLRLRGRARGREPLDRLLPEAFGAVCVATQRVYGIRPFDVQLVAGVVLHEGGLAELATGEGKTLCAVPPTFLNALPGKGAHLTTVNDYLARRDAEWTGPIYGALGLETGVLQLSMEDPERRMAYQKDITYGTSAAFGFDFLRDRIRLRNASRREAGILSAWSDEDLAVNVNDLPLQRGHHFALVDEADNIFIDEARTPLVISPGTPAASEEEQAPFRWADRVAQGLERDRHFVIDEKTRRLELTRLGRREIRWSDPPRGSAVPRLDKLVQHVEQSLHAYHRLRRDEHYLVKDDKVIIIDESTGRLMPDRSWGEGLHQAVQAKEGVTIARSTSHAAQVTYQNYFRFYDKLCGMTGTAAENFWELRRVYKLWVVSVPTNQPVLREQWLDRVFPHDDAKFDAVVAEVKRLTAQGRPVLIGTRSVEHSERLSQRLERAKIGHAVLNARHHESEAQIIAGAGEPERVTIATNMAGRGTDIKLGPGVAAAGGLHVLGTERHESIRIDRQLAGRAGRQGDPGSCQFFLSLEDNLLEALGPERREGIRAEGRIGTERDWQSYHPLFKKAQRRMERRHYGERIDLLIVDKQRRKILKELGADPFVD